VRFKTPVLLSGTALDPGQQTATANNDKMLVFLQKSV
jgi:hypothetical protein